MIWFLIIWLTFSVISYGVSLGTWIKAFPWQPATRDSVIAGIMGPLGLIAFIGVALVTDMKLAFRLRPPTREEQFDIYRREYPILVETGYSTFDGFDKGKS